MPRTTHILLATLLAGGLVALASCKKTMPTVTIASISPDTIISVSDSATIIAAVSDPSNLGYAIEWTATGGWFNYYFGDTVKWAPPDTGLFRVSAILTCGSFAQKDTDSRNVRVRAIGR